MYDDVGVAGTAGAIAIGTYVLNMTLFMVVGGAVILGSLLLVRLWARRHP